MKLPDILNNKKALLIAGSVIALLCWQLAFKNTLNAWLAYKDLNKQLDFYYSPKALCILIRHNGAI